MYIFNKKFEGNIFWINGGRKILLTEKLSKKDMEFLYKINHPSVKYQPISNKKNEDVND